MTRPAPSTCFWVHEGHVAACRKAEFHALQDSWCSSPRSSDSPLRTPGPPAAPHPHPSLATRKAEPNVPCPKCGLCWSLQIMQPWHRGRTEAMNWIQVWFSI